MDDFDILQPGQLLARGTARHLRLLGFPSLEEFVPTRGLRVDLMVLGPKEELWIVECKSSKADFMSDNKWHNYLEWCGFMYLQVNWKFRWILNPKKPKKSPKKSLPRPRLPKHSGKNANAKAARQDRESVAGVTRHFLQIFEPSFYDVQAPVCPMALLSQWLRHRHRR